MNLAPNAHLSRKVVIDRDILQDGLHEAFSPAELLLEWDGKVM